MTPVNVEVICEQRVAMVVLKVGWAGTVRYFCCFLLLWAVLEPGGVLSCTWDAPLDPSSFDKQSFVCGSTVSTLLRLSEKSAGQNGERSVFLTNLPQIHLVMPCFLLSLC
jgi:hypothetical protein